MKGKFGRMASLHSRIVRQGVRKEDTMAQRLQRGWLKKEKRVQGETWVLYFRTMRRTDGRRAENKIPIGLVRDLPEHQCARAEVERLHLPMNPVDSRRGLTVGGSSSILC